MPRLFPDEVAYVIGNVADLDDLLEPVYSYEECQAVRVLVQPGGTSALAADRPHGVKVAFTLYFPKSFIGSLRGCLVELRGERYRVVGDPQPYAADCVPGDWNRVVEVSAVHG